MQPTKPGRYQAREIAIDMLGNKMFSLPYYVNVVADVPNIRNHHLLVETGVKQPRYKSLDCYEWLPTDSQNTEHVQQSVDRQAGA